MSFCTTRRVEFSHCDPAGIVFYPRYFEMLNSVVEELFSRHVGKDFAQMHLVEGYGVPTVHLDVDFMRPGRLGDELNFELTVQRVGRSSADLRVSAAIDGAERLVIKQTIVWMELSAGKSAPWPTDVAAKLKELI